MILIKSGNNFAKIYHYTIHVEYRLFYLLNSNCVQVNVGIVLKRSQDDWSEGRIRDYIGANLPSTRTITGRIYYIKRIPHNPQGKKLRREMKNFVLNLEEHSAV